MKRFSECIFLLLVLFVAILMLLYPQAAYQGACQGLETWAVHLVPSLLPFFIVADLLLSLGFVRLLGVLLEPIMRPLFRLPGEAGFAVALGFTSGFPMGAVLTASLKEQQLCTTKEAARLAAFTNNSSPLFLLIAVPVSMLHQPQLGTLLLASHYLANLTIGILLRFTAPPTPILKVQSHLLCTAVNEMKQYRQQQNKSIGTLLSCSVQKATKSILTIGGFVLLFSVLLQLLQAAGLLLFLQNGISFLLQLLQIDCCLSAALSAGLFEMTLGAQTAAQSQAALLQKLMMISFILGWSGFSIQAQVSSILAEQKISSQIYCLCRPLHGLLAAAFIPLLTILFPNMLLANVFLHLQPILTPIPYLPFVLFPMIALLLLLLLSLIFHIFFSVINK